jgi:hypothetical protein
MFALPCVDVGAGDRARVVYADRSEKLEARVRIPDAQAPRRLDVFRDAFIPQQAAN